MGKLARLNAQEKNSAPRRHPRYERYYQRVLSEAKAASAFLTHSRDGDVPSRSVHSLECDLQTVASRHCEQPQQACDGANDYH